MAAADRRGAGTYGDPGPDRLVAECVEWLERAQDLSASADGGVARHYSPISGWAPSYPETTGYIVPSLLAYAERSGRQDLIERARRMLDWLAAIQFPEGAFQGGVVGAVPRVPVVFNTGQILLGLAAGERSLGGYRDALCRAADWLVAMQDSDGGWRRHASPFALAGDKAYDTHVAWGLIEAERICSGAGYGEAALANIRWALRRQQTNGWFADCCLSDPCRPITHTLGYALRGVVEGYRFSGEAELLTAARRTADGLISALRPDGWLPGRLDARWRAAADWVCLTGSSQIAHCWLQLYQITGVESYRDAARRTNAWVRRTVSIDGPGGQRGGVKGAFPFDGGYGAFEFLNWAVKFTVDANLLEQQLDNTE
jgi:Squalene-hopene cyclase C-terminal domain